MSSSWIISGDIVYLRILGQDLLFINSYEVATDLLDKRSTVYSSRPHIVMVHELYERLPSSASVPIPSLTVLQTEMGLGTLHDPVRRGMAKTCHSFAEILRLLGC